MISSSTTRIIVAAGIFIATLHGCGTDELKTRVIDRRTQDAPSEDAHGQADSQVDEKGDPDGTTTTDDETTTPSPSPSASASPTPPPADPCVLAQTEFNLKVQLGIEASCGNGGCHGTGSGGLTLSKGTGNQTTNRLTIRNLIANNFNNLASSFINKYTSAGHGGGNQSGNLPAASTNGWWAKELNCTP